MELKCIGTGSAGNCYLLIDDLGAILVLDLGISFKKMALDEDFDINKVHGILVSHLHADHASQLSYFESIGIPLLSYKTAVERKTYKFGNFAVMPFAVNHDVINFGFIIKNIHSNQVYIYATDTTELPYIKAKANWLVEINYDMETWKRKINKIEDDQVELKVLNRVVNTHMSLETINKYFSEFSKNELPNKILICHTSNSGCLNEKTTLETMGKFCGDVKIVRNKTIYNF